MFCFFARAARRGARSAQLRRGNGAMARERHGGMWFQSAASIRFAAPRQIMVTELGDETFIIAAIMAMRHSRLVVYFGAMTALTFMTVRGGRCFDAGATLGWALRRADPTDVHDDARWALF